MLVLFETAAGYAVFKLLDEKKIQESDNIWKDFESPELASKTVQLVSFKKFKDTTESLEAAAGIIEGRLSKTLKKFLKKNVIGDLQEQLAVADAKMGNMIKEKCNINCVANGAVNELMRGIRSQMDSLITDLPKKDMSAMALGLAHSLSRYKLKFSADKVDTMIIQAVSLLDDLDKELNNYIMRTREWYGWHFPELGKIVQDNLVYAKLVRLIGLRTNTADMDLSPVLPEELIAKVKEAAEISMGTEISDLDMLNISSLCDQVIEITEYRSQLYEYLKNRMMALAPNLTVLLGELVGARLVSHAGSLMNLAKYPASTVQILGAEKALFRALKTKKDTPKYGLIYHAQLIGQAPTKLKGKMSRMLAAKAALACRVDAIGEDNNMELGIEHKAKLEARLQQLQEQPKHAISGTGRQKAQFQKHQFKKEFNQYDNSADASVPQTYAKKHKFEAAVADEEAPQAKKVKVEEPENGHVPDEETETPKAKKRKVKKEVVEQEEANGIIEEPVVEEDSATPKKKKKSKKAAAE